MEYYGLNQLETPKRRIANRRIFRLLIRRPHTPDGGGSVRTYGEWRDFAPFSCRCHAVADPRRSPCTSKSHFSIINEPHRSVTCLPLTVSPGRSAASSADRYASTTVIIASLGVATSTARRRLFCVYFYLPQPHSCIAFIET